VLSEYRAGVDEAIACLRVEDRRLPVPGRGEVLIRMEAAPVNQSDLLFLQGLYGVRKPLPAVPGWEGAGTVVASGGGLMARTMLGRRVACGGQTDADGTWAEYYVTSAKQCSPLLNQVDFEQGATSLINPLTALGMLEAIRLGHHRAAIQNAAVSQVGLMMVRLCRKAGIPLVNIVRREAQAEVLRAEGERHVLDSSSAGFAEALSPLARELGATIAFDAVAGEMTGLLLGAMPEDSKVVVYGALSAEASRDLDPIQVIFRRKRVEGFYLGDWLAGKGFLGSMRAVRKAQASIVDGTLSTKIARRIPLSGLQDGLRDYVRHLSEGKALITLG